MRIIIKLIIFSLTILVTAHAQVPQSDEASPAVEVQPSPPQALPETQGAFFYYCQKVNSYYPQVKECADGWIAVPVGPAVPIMPMVEPPPEATEETVKSQPNAFSFEVLGRALAYSLDYDRAISAHLTLGVGISNWESNNWERDYYANITVVPVYANYYFSQNPSRSFVTAGADWIHVTQAGYDDSTFTNNGFAAVLGGGYEIRDASGFLLRLGGFVIIGRSLSVSPLASLGFAF